jgi:uncharacterized protein YcbX
MVVAAEPDGDAVTESHGVVIQVARHPVKSLEGELLDACNVDLRGLSGDRLWAVCDPDGKLGSGKSSRRFRRMEGLRDLVAVYDGDVPVITFPDASSMRGDDPDVHARLSRHVGRPVRLQRETTVSHHDDGPVHLVTTASLRALSAAVGAPVDVRRARANLVVDWAGADFTENEWAGQHVRVGELVLEITMRMPRCVMVNAATRDLPAHPDVLRTLGEVNDATFGVLAEVVQPGVVRHGDVVQRLTPVD